MNRFRLQIVIFVVAFNFVSLFNVCASNETKEGVMKSMITRCRIGTDEDFAKIIADFKHAPSVVASEEFRTLVKALAPFRMDLHPGIEWKNKRLVFYWFIGEFGVKKPAADVLALFSETLSTLGFKTSASGADRNSKAEYTKTAGDVVYRVRLERLERFIGTSTPSSGGTFSYEIENTKDVEEPLLEDVLKAYPSLECPEMIPEIFEFFRKQPVRNVSYGGTWTQYYSFDIDAEYKDEKAAKEAYDTLIKKVTALGFALEREDRGVLTYMKAGSSAPVLYLALEKGGIVNFRIQPYT
jgi:hypothetical protein